MSKFSKGDPVTVKNNKGLVFGRGVVQEKIEKTGFYSVRFDGGRPSYPVNYPPDRLELITNGG